MKRNTRFDLHCDFPAGRSTGACRRRSCRPWVERLEDRQLLAASTLSAIQQYGTPSVFAIDQSGNVFSNTLTVVNNQTVFGGWTPISGASGALAISTGTVGVSAFLRPNMFLLNTAHDIYYNVENSSGNWQGFSPVGVNVEATAISSGLIPILNAPYVVMINSANDVYFNYQTPGGSWAGWSPVAVGVGAEQIATGVIQVSASPAIYEPYVFMVNANHDVNYTLRNTNGSWAALSPVGASVGAEAISAVTLNNKPYVTMLNSAGGVYVNFGLSNQVSSRTPHIGPGSAGKLRPGVRATGRHHHAIAGPRSRAPMSRRHASARVPTRETAMLGASSQTWAGWSPVGTGSTSDVLPATAMASVGSDYSIYAFAVNGAGQVNSTFGNYGNWHTWFGLGTLASGVSAASIAVTSNPIVAPVAFAIGTDGNVYWNFQSAWATWSQWASLGTPI